MDRANQKREAEARASVSQFTFVWNATNCAKNKQHTYCGCSVNQQMGKDMQMHEMHIYTPKGVGECISGAWGGGTTASEKLSHKKRNTRLFPFLLVRLLTKYKPITNTQRAVGKLHHQNTLTRVLAADGGLVAEVGHHAAGASGRVQHDGEAVHLGAEAVVVVPLLIREKKKVVSGKKQRAE